jgi:predicted MFS family arabinose efflux permease
MIAPNVAGARPGGTPRQPWLPMVVIAMGQAQMSLNVNALPVSIGGIVTEFSTAPTTIGTAIVAHSVAVAGFTMLGAKLGQKFGSLRVFRMATLVLLLAMAMMAASPGVAVMLAAQVLAGLAAAEIVPALVVLIVHNYAGAQQARALGILGAVQAMAAVSAFFVAGVLGTYLGWRYAFGLVIPFAAATLALSLRLAPVPKTPDLRIDGVGVFLAVATVVLISVGVNNLYEWGTLLAGVSAPFNVLGLSPAPVMIVAGVVGIQLFIAWAQRRQSRLQTPLLALQVIDSPREHAAALAMMAIFMLANALTFLVPLYIQMVQGRTSLETAIAMIPYQVAVFASAISVLGLADRLTPRQIARGSFVLISAALVLLAQVMSNEWSNVLVVLGLVMFGVGQGALATLLFNVLVTYAPKQFAGDVGSLRGTIKNLAAGVGTALAGALAVGILSVNIERSLVDNPTIPPELIRQVDLNRATFVSNAHLKDVMTKTTATAEQVSAAVHINAEARLRALKLSLLFLAGVSLLVIVPAGRLPGYVRGQAPDRRTSRG